MRTMTCSLPELIYQIYRCTSTWIGSLNLWVPSRQGCCIAQRLCESGAWKWTRANISNFVNIIRLLMPPSHKNSLKKSLSKFPNRVLIFIHFFVCLLHARYVDHSKLDSDMVLGIPTFHDSFISIPSSLSCHRLLIRIRRCREGGILTHGYCQLFHTSKRGRDPSCFVLRWGSRTR